MLSQLRSFVRPAFLTRRAGAPSHDDTGPSARALHALTGPLLLAAAAQTARQAGNPLRPFDADAAEAGMPPVPAAVAWGPLLVAPVAAAAHLTHAVHPSSATRAALRLFDAAAIGAGIVGLAGSALHARTARGVDPAIPLAATAFGLAGLLGFLLDSGAPTRIAPTPVESAPEPSVSPVERARSLARRLPRRRRRQRLVIHV
jgi:hypothetical protein